jgi:hypothetical protein
VGLHQASPAVPVPQRLFFFGKKNYALPDAHLASAAPFDAVHSCLLMFLEKKSHAY